MFSRFAAPPMPTLFPYTTLFRSRGARVPREQGRRAEPHGGEGVRRGESDCCQHDGRGARAEPARRAATVDRKSTRLNSSHTVISYAVFCLKKQIRRRSCERPTRL